MDAKIEKYIKEMNKTAPGKMFISNTAPGGKRLRIKESININKKDNKWRVGLTIPSSFNEKGLNEFLNQVDGPHKLLTPAFFGHFIEDGILYCELRENEDPTKFIINTYIYQNQELLEDFKHKS